MANILLFTADNNTEVLPALGLLSHRVKLLPASTDGLFNLPSFDLIVLDARTNLSQAKAISLILDKLDQPAPIMLVLTEGGLSAVQPDWPVAEIILNSAGPAEVETRIRLAMSTDHGSTGAATIQAAGMIIDEASYSAKLHGRPLDLTFKEFELLRFLASHPSRVFSREQLLSEVWGYDYFGGTRTVDVHIRRLRAKLGELEQLIGTVRNVGYRFNLDADFEDDGEL